MNQLEARYAQTIQGRYAWVAFEGIKLRLADKTFYTPDFFVMAHDGQLECHEVKGFMEEDANVKIKCAAEKFPFKFILIQFKRGEWITREI